MAAIITLFDFDFFLKKNKEKKIDSLALIVEAHELQYAMHLQTSK